LCINQLIIIIIIIIITTTIIIKAIPVTGRGGPQGCETSRLPHFLVNRLANGGEVATLTVRLAALYPQEDSWYPFMLEVKSTPGSWCGWKV
jgi:hypothetical protein